LILDPGVYNINASLNVPDKVILAGSGYSTVLFQQHNCTGPLLNLGRASGVRDLQTQQEQTNPNASPFKPYTDYDFQIRVLHDQATLSNLMLLNPYKGIAIESPPGGAVGQIIIENIRGQPLNIGIQIDHALDVIHIHQLHFWPFWAATTSVISWVQDNGIGIRSIRNDNPLLSQMFFFGYNIGILFDKPSCSGTDCGITSKPKIVQFDCDFCINGVMVQGDGVRGLSLSEFSYQAPGDGNGVALQIEGNGCTATVSQADFTLAGANSVRVDGSTSFVVVTASLLRSWNLSGKGFPCFEAPGSGSQILATNSFYGDGHGAQPCGTNTVCDNILPASLG